MKRRLTFKELEAVPRAMIYTHPIVLGGAGSDMRTLKKKYWDNPDKNTLDQKDKRTFYKSKAILFEEIAHMPLPVDISERFLREAKTARQEAETYSERVLIGDN